MTWSVRAGVVHVRRHTYSFLDVDMAVVFKRARPNCYRRRVGSPSQGRVELREQLTHRTHAHLTCHGISAFAINAINICHLCPVHSPIRVGELQCDTSANMLNPNESRKGEKQKKDRTNLRTSLRDRDSISSSWPKSITLHLCSNTKLPRTCV